MSNQDKERARALLSGLAPADQRFAEPAPPPVPPAEPQSQAPTIDEAKELKNEINKEQNTPPSSALAERRRGRPTAPPSEDPLEAFSNRIRRSLHRKMKLHAVQSGKSIQEILDEALEGYLS